MRIIAVIIIACVMCTGCNFDIPFTKKTPKTWSQLLKSSPKQMQERQAHLKSAMAKLKK